MFRGIVIFGERLMDSDISIFLSAGQFSALV